MSESTGFNFMEPLPVLHHDCSKARSWEPAARHYRDIDPEPAPAVEPEPKLAV